MKSIKTFVLFFFVSMFALSLSFAGDVENGKKLFNDPKLSESKNDKTCTSCHPEGRGLEKTGTQSEFKVMGMDFASLEDVINFCLEKPMVGKPLPKDSKEMKDLKAYIKSIGK